MLTVKLAKNKDLKDIAHINLSCFHGSANLKEALQWVSCNFSAFPRFQYFVLKEKNEVLGYILWYFKGGWRKKSVLELEQIAIESKHQDKGLGSRLIIESLKQLRIFLKKEGRGIKALVVTTSTTQRAQKIYEKVLKTKPEAKIKKLFRGDEIILVRRY